MAWPVSLLHPRLPLTPIPSMADVQLQDRTGKWIVPTETDYMIGIIPSPVQVIQGNRKGIAIALAIEGTNLPMQVSEFQTATLVNGHVFPVGLIMEMGC
jgi:uncharacterized membrane protein